MESLIGDIFIAFKSLDLLLYGLLYAALIIAYIYVLTYLLLRGRIDKPQDKAFSLIAPAIIAGIFLKALNIVSELIGLAVIMIFVLTVIFRTDHKKEDLVIIIKEIILGFLLVALLHDILKVIIAILILIYAYIRSEYIIKKKKEKKDAKK